MKLGRLQGKEVVVIFNEIISQIISCAEKNELNFSAARQNHHAYK